MWRRYLGFPSATSAPESFILMKNVTVDHSFMFWPAEEHLRFLKTRFWLDIAGPCCDCESVHSVPGKIMARQQTSLKCPEGKQALWQTVCDTTCVAAWVGKCFQGCIHGRRPSFEFQRAVWSILQHGSKQNVILYWTPQCITHAHSKQQLTTDAPCWLSTVVCTVGRGEKIVGWVAGISGY